ncbi:NADH-quinone oxidoreductase subunit A [Actinomycetospora sp. NBRC 106378]|uniref:NADH-quinone oxidoreductase subunit A n=1 Tax=Actinomycetospora sp. NBRC 106378 TaxID=3032208 RepID=UPI00249FA7CD|nr:NADH-quinone oxidoreductase subunit A [Actinomycetospora sp. NBRC 106378]GLZ53855.1 NADH-quinone oxidoreductase subunit A 1 [Actinomycetospora sp. NBRC 106378]
MSPFVALAVVGGAALVGVGLVVAVSWTLRATRGRRRPLVAAPHAGGMPVVEHAVSRWHVRWPTLALVFLAFDMEMLFMYPWTLVVARTGTGAAVEMFVFLAVLLVGVGYAWREGAFRWS